MLDFKNKKALVMGLGLNEEGSGISAVKFLLQAGAQVTVTDLKTKTQLASQIKRLGNSAKKIKFVLGCHRESDFLSADLVLKNPGVPRTSAFLKLASDLGVPIYTDISLFFQLFGTKKIIGITGTRGKSTTTSLIYELIKHKDKGVIIGGNIQKSPLTQLESVLGHWAVLELSSWMLESLEPIKLSPHIAVFNNIYPDHLNTYSGLDDYISAKKNILRFQNSADFLVINRDNNHTRKIGKEAVSKRFWFSLKSFDEENGSYIKDQKIFFRREGVEQEICSVSEVAIIGRHNLENILGAVTVVGILGISPKNIKKTLQQFKGIANRLELIKNISGVDYYNDTTSTTPEATLAGLKTLGSKRKNIILLAGGADKGLDFGLLPKNIDKYCKAVILFSGTGTERLKKYLKNSSVPLTIVNSMSEAVNLSQAISSSGDVVLLSPACASFGMFVNEFDRGQQFVDCVNNIKL